eukprot:g1395.t1
MSKGVPFKYLAHLKKNLRKAEEKHHIETDRRRRSERRRRRRRLRSAIAIQSWWRGECVRASVNEVLNFKLGELLQKKLDIKRSDGKWLEVRNAHNYSYFLHAATGEVRWNKPEEIFETQKWNVCFTEDDDQTLYYYNAITGESKWELCTYDNVPRGNRSRKWRHDQVDDGDRSTSESGDESDVSEREEGQGIMSVIGSVGANAMSAIRDSIIQRAAAVVDRNEAKSNQEELGEPDADKKMDDSASTREEPISRTKSLPSMLVETPFGRGRCLSVRDADKVWTVEISDGRRVYCPARHISIGRGYESAHIGTAVDTNTMKLRRVEAERNSELRIAEEIKRRFPVPPGPGFSGETDSGAEPCIPRVPPIIPMIRNFVSGFSEGINSEEGGEN